MLFTIHTEDLGGGGFEQNVPEKSDQGQRESQIKVR